MISVAPMGRTAEGLAVERYTLKNASGAYAEISTLGGCLMSICVPDGDGNLGDVTLGYADLSALERAGGYMGMLIGRFGNRIGNARFTLNGKTYQLAKNDGENHLHGGLRGFDKKIWQARIEGETLALTIHSPDGEEGYPGALDVTVRYAFSEDNALSIRYAATAHADTVLNLTNHVYFNLSGPESSDFGAQKIRIDADRFVPVRSAASIPTGELRDVTGTPLDLRAGRVLLEGLALREGCEQMRFGNGYDHNFVVNGWDGTLREVCEVIDPKTRRRMRVLTTEPGLQLYTGNSISGDVPGKCGMPYRSRQGFCLETQHFPDTPNQPGFPSCVVRAGETYRSETVYAFDCL